MYKYLMRMRDNIKFTRKNDDLYQNISFARDDLYLTHLALVSAVPYLCQCCL